MQWIIDGWNSAPTFSGKKLYLNIPAFVIVCLIGWLTYVGIKESKRSANAMVIFKLAVIVFVIVLGFFYVKPSNWHPFLPNGFGGVLLGVSAVFYAYIGFDAISTTAEECRNPQRDLPKGMMYSLVICTVLYILIALVLTGMVPFGTLNVKDPLSFVFKGVQQDWISYIVDVSAVVATTSVLLVFQLGQPRIWMSMSRDGLLPRAFGKVHAKYKTPYFSTIASIILVAVPSLFVQSGLMTDLTSIGTLFAFVLVSGGVLMLPRLSGDNDRRSFKLPYINGKIIVPLLYALFVVLMWDRIVAAARNLGGDSLQEVLFLAYMLVGLVLSVLTFVRNLSFIPIMGVLFCAYLLIEIPAVSWMWFFGWMEIGLLIYFLYGYSRSKLARENR
jgi:APA family basic amino acid/polyamine antiporter